MNSNNESDRSSRTIAIAVVVLVMVGAFLYWRWTDRRKPLSDAVTQSENDRDPTLARTENRPDYAGQRDPINRTNSTTTDTIAPDHTVRDAVLREAVRRAILASWDASTPALAPTPVPTTPDVIALMPMPEMANGAIDPQYIRDRIREDFLPMASTCYESLRVRNPAAQGRLTVAFTVIAHPQYGGLVDHVDGDHEDAGLGDETFRECITGSMETMVFRPPPHGGTVTVHYPFTFSLPDDAAAD